MDTLTQQVLAWVNETRRERFPRLELLTGLIHGDKECEFECPVARSLKYKIDMKVEVTYDDWYEGENRCRHLLPQFVESWIKDFDLNCMYDNFEATLAYDDALRKGLSN